MDRRCPRPPRAALLVSAALVLLSGACAREAAEPDEEADVTPTITADTIAVARRDIARDLVVRGTLTALPNEDVRVSSLVPGRVDALTVAEGDAVAKGQVVARIDTRTVRDQQRQAEAQRSQAAAQVDTVQRNLTRTEQLFSRGVAAGKEVEDARVAVAEARAALEQAEAALSTVATQLDRAEIRSPIAGHVVKRMVSVGEQVDGTAGAPIVEIANLEWLELAASVPASELPSLTVGQTVAASSTVYPDRTFPGSIVAVAPSVDPATNTTLVRIRIQNRERLLKVGMYAEARVRLEAHPQALVVPLAALARDAEGAAVYVVRGDVATRTEVGTGLEQGGEVEIVKGLEEGARVLASGVHGLGESVRLAAPK
ncbi:MAG: efflux RND transporter periplasmic adaptor subunit [Vicinamibacterales bacterium]